MLAALAVGLIGLIVEVFVLRRLYQAPELFILFATFGVVLMIQDLSRWLFGAEDILGPPGTGIGRQYQYSWEPYFPNMILP